MWWEPPPTNTKLSMNVSRQQTCQREVSMSPVTVCKGRFSNSRYALRTLTIRLTEQTTSSCAPRNAPPLTSFCVWLVWYIHRINPDDGDRDSLRSVGWQLRFLIASRPRTRVAELSTQTTYTTFQRNPLRKFGIQTEEQRGRWTWLSYTCAKNECSSVVC